MPSDSEAKHHRRSHSRERERSKRSRSRSRDRNRNRERDRDRNRERERERDRERDRERERDRNRNGDREREKEKDSYDRKRNRSRERNDKNREREKKTDNEKIVHNDNSKDNKINNDFRAKKPRIENNGDSKSINQNTKNENKEGEGEKKKIEKEKPNYNLTGKLAEDTNTYNGVVLKYSEPPEARKTTVKWRFHIFKGDTQLDPLPVYRQSGYLLGRDRLVADIPIDHPSCSKQHAVLQYRQVQGTDENGEPKMVVKPYLIDLNSSNGTFINGEKLEPSRYYELKQGDVVKFGFSTRDYIFLDEDSV